MVGVSRERSKNVEGIENVEHCAECLGRLGVGLAGVVVYRREKGSGRG